MCGLTCLELSMLYSSCDSCKLVSFQQLTQREIAYLTSSVDDLCQVGLSLVDDLMAECILDGGIVTLDEVTLAVLDCQ